MKTGRKTVKYTERVSRYLRQEEAVVIKSRIENGAKNTRPNMMERSQSGSRGESPQ